MASIDNEQVWAEVQASDEFQALKKKFRNFAFPVTLAFLAWYFSYILLTVYAREWVSTEVFPHINIAIILGVSQFLTTFLIAFLYERHSSKHLDAASDALRDKINERLAK